MRILFVINSFTLAGAEKLVFDLSQRLRPACAYVGIAALYRLNLPTEEEIRRQLQANHIQTYILDKPPKRKRLATVQKLVQIEKRENVQVIHAHCSVPMLMGKLSGFLSGIPVVCTVHNSRGYSALRERSTGWMARQYISIGEAVENYMVEQLHIPAGKITRIYNGVDSAQFYPEEAVPGFWAQYGFLPDVPVILHIGRVAEQKNQICLIRALAKCKKAGRPFQLAILGGFSETDPLYRRLREEIETAGLGDLVRFLGIRRCVRPFLNQAACFVMTSRYEGLSVSFLEAVMCGTPIVVTDMPFVRELLHIGPCATVFPQDDADALAQILMEQSYEKPSAQVQARFRQRFCMEQYAARHLALYLQIVRQ